MSQINGGGTTFGYDVGWSVGFLWKVIKNDYAGMAVAVVKYDTHEH